MIGWTNNEKMKNEQSLLDRRLNRPALFIIERIVKEKDVGDLKADGGELAPELLESMRPQPSRDESTQMFRTKLDLDRTARMQRESHITDRAEMMANCAAFSIGAGDQRLAFADGQRFQAVRAERFSRDAVPVPRVVAASATRDLWRHAIRRGQTQTFHRSPPWRAERVFVDGENNHRQRSDREHP